MLTITTKSVNDRDDWYQATAKVDGRIYIAHEMTRLAALMHVAHQLALKGYLKL